MTRQVQFRRGTTIENDGFIGAAGEIVVDSDKQELRLHDGNTKGGVAIPTEAKRGFGKTVTLAQAVSSTNAKEGYTVIISDRGNGLFEYKSGEVADNIDIFAAANGLFLVRQYYSSKNIQLEDDSTLQEFVDDLPAEIDSTTDAKVETHNLDGTSHPDKASIAYVDNIVAAIGSGAPAGTFATLGDLQTAFPAGDSNIYVVTANGNWYYYSGSWLAGGLYQSTGIADNSVEERHLTFSVASKNLFDKTAASTGFYVDYTTGNLIASGSNSASDYMPVLESTMYHRNENGQMSFYDSGKVYISGLLSGRTFTTPANTAFIRTTVPNADLDTEQVELGGVGTTYVGFEPLVDSSRISPTVDKSKLAFLTPSTNLFDKDDVTVGFFVDPSNGTLQANGAFVSSAYIAVNPSTLYSKVTNRQIAYYELDGTYISGLNSGTRITTSPANADYLRFSMQIAEAETEQLNEGATLLEYEEFGGRYKGSDIERESIPDTALESDYVESVESRNLYNKDTSTDGFFVQFNNGGLSANASFTTSDYTPVEELTTYIWNGAGQIAFYDEAKVYISGELSNKNPTSPANAAFIRISVRLEDKDTEQFELGYYRTKYESAVKVIDAPSKRSVGRTYVVDAGGNGDFTTIQPALNAAGIGATSGAWGEVVVMDGTYNGQLIPVKYVHLRGVNRDAVTIHYDGVFGDESNQDTFKNEPTIWKVSNLTATGLHVKYVMHIDESTPDVEVEVDNVKFEKLGNVAGGSIGIGLWAGHKVKVTNSDLIAQADINVNFYCHTSTAQEESATLIVENNRVTGCKTGILLETLDSDMTNLVVLRDNLFEGSSQDLSFNRTATQDDMNIKAAGNQVNTIARFGGSQLTLEQPIVNPSPTVNDY